MIHYKIGDLVQALENLEVEAIAHQANCFCTMRSGIAPLIANKWPEVREVDRETGFGEFQKMGYFSVAATPDGHVFNIYGQYHWDRGHNQYGTSYSHLGLGLARVRDYLDDHKISSIGLPLIGCGLAGGDWGLVSGLIEEAFKDWEGQVIVYTLKEVEGLDYGLA